MKSIYYYGAVVLFTCLLSACSENTSDQSPDQKTRQSSAKASHGQIDWFKGDVDAAFAEAKASNKPVFLYWGAVWCPPCQEIRNTVFKSQRFLELSKEFVAVYLDGDTDAAQQAGERFGTKGYPTMIVLNSKGEELTRIPGGIDISRYNDVLADSLNIIQPTKQLVARLIQEEALNEAELKQLAFYSWGQDHGALPDEFDPLMFKRASEQSRNPIVSSRLYMQYLIQHQQSVKDDEELVVVEGAYERVSDILEDSSLVLANWSEFIYYAKDLIPLISTEDNADNMKSKWQAQTLDLRETKSLSTADKLGGFFPALDIAELSETEVSAEITEALQIAVAQADKVTTNASARQSVINRASYLLNSYGLIEEAKSLLLAEIDKSEAPYYFMTPLGSIAEKQEDPVTALSWHKRAFDESVGKATRLQWGATYVRALIRLTPEDHDTIVSVANKIIQDTGPDEDLFSGRNFRVARSLAKSLHDWQAENERLNQMFSNMTERCSNISDNEVLKNNCDEVTSPWQTQPLAEAGLG